jgi:hypothetical protein
MIAIELETTRAFKVLPCIGPVCKRAYIPLSTTQPMAPTAPNLVDSRKRAEGILSRIFIFLRMMFSIYFEGLVGESEIRGTKSGAIDSPTGIPFTSTQE